MSIADFEQVNLKLVNKKTFPTFVRNTNFVEARVNLFSLSNYMRMQFRMPRFYMIYSVDLERTKSNVLRTGIFYYTSDFFNYVVTALQQ